MGSLIDEVRRREAAARAEADRLRARIEEFAEDLARAAEQVARLAIAREEVTRVLEEPAAAGPSAGKPAGELRPASPQPAQQEGPDHGLRRLGVGHRRHRRGLATLRLREA